jgi:hypothetical protein
MRSGRGIDAFDAPWFLLVQGPAKTNVRARGRVALPSLEAASLKQSPRQRYRPCMEFEPCATVPAQKSRLQVGMRKDPEGSYPDIQPEK